MVTIVYCIIGLPLTLMCIAKLGRAFALAFRVVYHTCCCAICCLACVAKKHKLKYRSRKLANSDINDALGALVIGKNREENKSKFLRENEGNFTTISIWREIIKTKYSASLRHDTTVPAYLCLIVMAAYIVGGAYLFTAWEDWSYLEGAYFCFVTLTTIGFGDFVPGVNKGTGEKQNLVLCALYVLIGLALIGMCIDLMQVDVIKKVKWISQKIGLSKPKHVKTSCDKKKEKVGLKLSSEILPQTIGNNQSFYNHKTHHDHITRSLSHNLGVTSPSSIRSNNFRNCVSMPNTPVTMKALQSRPSGFFHLPLSTTEEPELSDSESIIA
ncbi:KCNK18 [Bugula neritina]|uniref:KCNK18 n=1 Tax=Bugula neritina TaxID=10212 RepID=A0A7J7J9I3_BUGNE|nr:KCNK18 [Bugula neritina]